MRLLWTMMLSTSDHALSAVPASISARLAATLILGEIDPSVQIRAETKHLP
jgi:hypothetical protein